MHVANSSENAMRGSHSLWSVAFAGVVGMQFMTALADNVVRWFVIGAAKDYAADSDPATHAWILTLGTVCFVAPFLALAAPAGFLADRWSKRSTVIGLKLLEVALAMATLFAIGSKNESLLFVMVTLLGAQAALLGPAKVGLIPETLKPEALSSANAVYGLSTVGATILGQAIGSGLKDQAGLKGAEHLIWPAVGLISISVGGLVLSFLIAPTPAADPKRPIPWTGPLQTWNDLRELFKVRPLFRVALGIAFFYAIGSFAQFNIDLMTTESLVANGNVSVTESAKTPLLASLVLGVCIGSVLAAWLSGDHVELGLLPIGAFGVSMFSMMLCLVPDRLFDGGSTFNASYISALVLLLGLGVSAGLFSVPLEAYLQHRSDPQRLGSILSASNFMTFSGVLISAVAFYFAKTLRGGQIEGAASASLLDSQRMFLVAGLLTLPIFFYVVVLIPQAWIRFFVFLGSRIAYRVKVTGFENLPKHGGAVICPNHVSYVDAVLLSMTTSRPIRMIAWSGNFENAFMKWFANLFGVILINPTRPKLIVAGLKEARQAVLQGDLVCIFPEGGISRSGQLLGFRPGVTKIIEGTGAPVIPVYLDGLWGSIFSYAGGRFFWKIPQHVPYSVSIRFGKPVHDLRDVHQLRTVVAELGTESVSKRTHEAMIPARSFIRRCKDRLRVSKLADSMGADYTGGEALMRSLIARRLLRGLLGDDEKNVGILIPPGLPAIIANAAMALDKRVAVNLNYTANASGLNACAEVAELKHIITSRKVLEKLEIKESELSTKVIYLEDLRDKVSLLDKAIGWWSAYVSPAQTLELRLGLNSVNPDDVASIIFTSGSTGVPKGVMLTHANIQYNVEAINQAVRLTPDDVLIGVLPFFHVFGYTVTMWGPMSLDIKGAYHFSPLDAKQIGKLTQKHKGTLLLCTPTFLRTYVRRIDKEEFKTLDVVVTGAEKLPPELGAAFKEKFGVEPVEGFGATETTPLVAVNIPPSRSEGHWHVDRKAGTVGRPVTGCTVRVVNPETGEELPHGQQGMLHVKGPNIMKGYYNAPEATEKVLKDGWYNTGDLAIIDEDGFVTITGRLSRFSKIGGEMVPHIQIEEGINRQLGAGEELKAVVTAVPDEKKGERLIVLHLAMDKTPKELCDGLSASGVPNLFIPGTDSFFQIEAIPALASGKLDLKKMKEMAEEVTGKAKQPA